jgi:hypothetical protein
MRVVELCGAWFCPCLQKHQVRSNLSARIAGHSMKWQFGRTARETTTRPFAVTAAMSWRSGMAGAALSEEKAAPRRCSIRKEYRSASPAKRLSAGGRAFESVGLFARINRGNVLSPSDLLGCRLYRIAHSQSASIQLFTFKNSPITQPPPIGSPRANFRACVGIGGRDH